MRDAFLHEVGHYAQNEPSKDYKGGSNKVQGLEPGCHNEGFALRTEHVHRDDCDNREDRACIQEAGWVKSSDASSWDLPVSVDGIYFDAL